MKKKICTICKSEKTINNFSWKKKSENKKHSVCKSCKKDIDNSYYSFSKKRRKSIRKRASKNYEYLKEYTQRLKKIGKCKNCGDHRWYVLDFHHTENKEEGISNLLKGCSIEKLKKEIRKCTLLCSNCHRELHHFERNGDEANLVEALV